MERPGAAYFTARRRGSDEGGGGPCGADIDAAVARSISHWRFLRAFGVNPSLSSSAVSAPCSVQRPAAMSSTKRSALRSEILSASSQTRAIGLAHHSDHANFASFVQIPRRFRFGIGGGSIPDGPSGKYRHSCGKALRRRFWPSGLGLFAIFLAPTVQTASAVWARCRLLPAGGYPPPLG